MAPLAITNVDDTVGFLSQVSTNVFIKSASTK